jgi:hypothetical protein
MAERARHRTLAGFAREGCCVKFPWAIYIAKEDRATLAGLRLVHGIEVGEGSSEIWLRGKPVADTLQSKLAGLPALERFEWLPSNRLRRVDQRVPSRALPQLPWQPIATWSEVRLPLAAFPADLPPKIDARLVRSSDEKQPQLVLASIDGFNRFCATAAAIRLKPLRFAANATGEVLILGQPIPPLAGRRFVLRGRIAVPAGFAWQPAVSVQILERSWSVAGDAMIVWHEDGTTTRVHSEQFIPVTRSAVHATAAGLKASQ